MGPAVTDRHPVGRAGDVVQRHAAAADGHDPTAAAGVPGSGLAKSVKASTCEVLLP